MHINFYLFRLNPPGWTCRVQLSQSISLSILYENELRWIIDYCPQTS